MNAAVVEIKDMRSEWKPSKLNGCHLRIIMSVLCQQLDVEHTGAWCQKMHKSSQKNGIIPIR